MRILNPSFRIRRSQKEYRGQTLLIEATGNFTQEVVLGATVHLTVKYGLITLIRMETDLCDQMKAVDEECPLDGSKVIKKEVDIPSKVPPVGHSNL